MDKTMVNVLFIGGSHNSEIKKIPKIYLDVGFIELFQNRTPDGFIDYIVEPNIQPEKRELYYVTKMWVGNDDDYKIYVAIEHNKLMLVAKNELHDPVSNLKKLGIEND